MKNFTLLVVSPSQSPSSVQILIIEYRCWAEQKGGSVCVCVCASGFKTPAVLRTSSPAHGDHNEQHLEVG